MIEIVKVKNPFNKAEREVEQRDFNPGKPLSFYVSSEEPFDFVLNGNFVEEPDLTYPANGDQIIIFPHVGGKFGKIFAIVATIALMAYGNSIMAGKDVFFKTFTKSLFSKALAAGAVMYIGGRIINAIVPQQTASSNSSNSEETYGWDTPSMIQGEGGVIGITYGTVIPTIQILEQHIETVDDKQYLNLLMCGGYGPVDEVTDIQIEGTSLDLFDDVETEIKLGTNEQEPVSFFTDTPLDQSIGLKLTTDGLIRTSESGSAVSLEVTLEFQSGLYKVNDSGNYVNASVVVNFYYRLTGSTDWIAFGENKTITAAQSTALRRAFRIKGLAEGQYEVRAIIISAPTGSRYQTTCIWSLLTSYNEGQYSRPNKVLVGMRILATDQLSNSVPNVTWRQKRSVVYAWNPITGAYVEKAANNPIWAAYDIYHQCRKLKNVVTGLYQYCVFGVNHSRLDPYWDEWVAAAAYADEQVLGADGITYENRFEFDYQFASEMKRYAAAQRAATVGHSVIMPRGNNIGIVTDKPGTVVQIFGEGRTTTSSVQGSFSAVEDRALAVEVIYNDADNDFKRTQFLTRSPRWNTSTKQDNTATLTLYGVKRKSQAYREGVYTLANNELITQFVEIGTNIDAMVCEYGQVVGYAHSVSQIGIASGRIVSATANTVKLDQKVDLLASQTYQIALQLSDDSIVTKSIVAVAEDTTTDTLTVSEAFAVTPQKYDNFLFGETDNILKKFRLTGIERQGDLTCKLSLTEYNENVYSDNLSYPVFAIPAKTTLQNPTALSLGVESNGSTNTLQLSWTMPRGAKYDSFAVFYTRNEGNWTYWGSTFDLQAKIANVIAGQTYYVKVVTKLSGMSSSGTEGNIAVTAGEPPDELEAFSVTYLNGKYVFTWKKPAAGAEITGYEIRKGSTWDSGQLVKRAVGADTNYTDSQALVGTIRFFAKPYNSGGYSENALNDLIQIDDLPMIHTLYSKKNFEQLCSITGDGVIADDYVYQTTNITYADIASKTYEVLSTAQLIGTPLGNAVLLGPVVTLDNLVQAFVSITEHWLWPPDVGNVYEISTSIDGTNFSDFKLLGSGSIPMKAFQLRITLAGTITPAIMQGIDVDVIASQTITTYSNITIPVGGLELVFDQPYSTAPSVMISPNNDALTPKKEIPTTISCKMYLVDSSGNDVGGTADVFVVGK